MHDGAISSPAACQRTLVMRAKDDYYKPMRGENLVHVPRSNLGNFTPCQHEWKWNLLIIDNWQKRSSALPPYSVNQM